MTTQVALSSRAMAKIDLTTRQWMAANLRRLKWEHRFDNDAAMAQKLGMSRSALNRYLKNERTAGLDLLLKVHRRLGASIDWMVDEPQDKRWMDPDYTPARYR